MESEIIQPFKGRINTVIIDIEMVYWSTYYILDKIEEKFGEIYTNEFISELSYAIERVSIKSEDFARYEVENGWYSTSITTDYKGAPPLDEHIDYRGLGQALIESWDESINYHDELTGFILTTSYGW